MTGKASSIEKAMLIMLRAHEGQVDKGGEPYVLHPLRVMMRVRSTEARVVALLHDVLEDSSLSLEDLHFKGFSPQVLNAVQCLTRRAGETYSRFILRVRDDPLAREVKIADLEDNLNVSRMASLTEKDLLRLRKYHEALKVLSIK